jgi:1,4-alpha-glucan branching enzyme
MENRKDYIDKPYSCEVHLGSWKRHEEDNRFFDLSQFADLVAYVKKQDLR